MNIGEVSEASGLPAKTIRHYEDIKLVRPARGTNGYRAFSERDAHKLAFLPRARSLGFSIEECRALLSLYEDRDRAALTSSWWPPNVSLGLPARPKSSKPCARRCRISSPAVMAMTARTVPSSTTSPVRRLQRHVPAKDFIHPRGSCGRRHCRLVPAYPEMAVRMKSTSPPCLCRN